MSKFPTQVLKIQSLIKGHLTRLKNQAIVRRIKQEAPKKTKKYQQVSKLQANIKGFLFRKRRMRALQKLGRGAEDDLDFQEDFDGEFDADKFFGIKDDVF